MDSVVLSLQDLIFYFQPPEELEHEEKQTRLRSLKNRQNLFQEEVSAHRQQLQRIHCTVFSIQHSDTFTFSTFCYVTGLF
jgi:hypothetical protein